LCSARGVGEHAILTEPLSLVHTLSFELKSVIAAPPPEDKPIHNFWLKRVLIRQALCVVVACFGIVGACRLRLALVLFGLSVIAAQAQEYPNRPIRMIIPYAPGGVVDVSARIVAENLGNILGQPIVMENRSGASGMLGAGVVAKAPADGYTLLLCPGDVFTIASLKPHGDVDVGRQLLPIAMINGNPMLVVANAKAPFDTVTGMVETAKASPRPLEYAIPGRGTVNDIIGQWIALEAGIKLQQIPYQGGSPGANGVAAGQVPLGIFSPPPVYPALVDAGKIKVLALTTKNHPSFLPSTWPTLIESGLPIDALNWQGLFGPTGMPDAVVARLDRALAQALQDESIAKRMNAFGMSPQFMPQAPFLEQIRADAARYARIIKEAGIAIEH
jgi:tripartite-type tricarboxylate transporter receptor subunit TctC